MPTPEVLPRTAAPPVAERKAPTNPEWLQEGWGSPNGWKIRLACLAYRYRAVPWILAWASAAGVAMMVAWRWNGSEVLPWIWWAGFAGLGGVWLASSAFIVAISGWFGVRFRYVAWGVATLCGTVARALRERGRALLLTVFFLLLIQEN